MKTLKVDIKEVVRQKYGEIASQPKDESAACCGVGCCEPENVVFSEDYTRLKGYNPDADLGLGCGLPTQFAGLKQGDTVVDLGSGAGNDCFVARAEVGESGRVIGLDFTDEMIAKARTNADKLGFTNIEFVKGDIEEMPLPDNLADVVISNCVLNLVPDKAKAFKQLYRVLKPGGHFSVSDIVLAGELPAEIQKAAELYVGCISGAIQKEEYLGLLSDTGFKNVKVQRELSGLVPDSLLKKYLNDTQLDEFRNSGTGIFSITVYGEKPRV
jgi:SAM-dependent methyltransferase